VANHLTWELVFRDAEISNRFLNGSYDTGGTGAIFMATRPDQFVTSASTTRTQPLTLADTVMQVLIGLLPPSPEAMGWISVGGIAFPNPNWKEWMQYYTPSFFGQGYTGYSPGSRTDPSTQPVMKSGMTAAALLGFTDYTDVDPSHIRVTTINTSGSAGWYAVDDATPFLNVGGSRLMPHDNDRQFVENTLSIATYGFRPVTLTGGQWLQDELTVDPLAESLLADTAKPHPFFQTLEIPGDPRVQLQDTVRIDDEVLGGPIFASIVGIRRTLSKREGVHDAYTLRTFGAIGGSWIMGDPVFSIMGSTTIVS